MKCPNCGSEDTNVYSGKECDGFRRRNRRCKACKKCFSTIEVVVESRRKIEGVDIKYRKPTGFYWRIKKCT